MSRIPLSPRDAHDNRARLPGWCCVWRVSTPKMPGNRGDAAHIEVGSGAFHTRQQPTERAAVRQCQFTLSAKHEPGVKSPVPPLSRRFSSTRLIPRDMRTDPESACVPRGINPLRFSHKGDAYEVFAYGCNFIICC